MKLASFKLPKEIKSIMTISVVITMLQLFIATISVVYLQPEVPMLYTLPSLEQQLVNKSWLFAFPIISISINLLHTVIMGIGGKKDITLLNLFSRATLVIQILLLLALVRIMYITI